MNALLVRAKAREKGLMVEYEAIVGDYAGAKEAGWIDWEDEVSTHLRMLKGWIRRAEAPRGE
jgi:hypothetical protein